MLLTSFPELAVSEESVVDIAKPGVHLCINSPHSVVLNEYQDRIPQQLTIQDLNTSPFYELFKLIRSHWSLPAGPKMGIW